MSQTESLSEKRKIHRIAFGAMLKKLPLRSVDVTNGAAVFIFCKYQSCVREYNRNWHRFRP